MTAFDFGRCHRCDWPLHDPARAFRVGAYAFCTLRCRRLFIEGVAA